MIKNVARHVSQNDCESLIVNAYVYDCDVELGLNSFMFGFRSNQCKLYFLLVFFACV